MTAQEKIILSRFFGKAIACLGSGYEGQAAVVYEDDPPSSEAAEKAGDFSSLPLAYQIPEDGFWEETSLEESSPANPLAMAIGARKNEQEEMLLDRMLSSIGISRDRNCAIVDEALLNDIPGLEEQIRTLMPKAILCLGKSKSWLFNAPEQIPILTTFHPAELLQDSSLKRKAFEDMKILMECLVKLDHAYAGEVKELLQRYAASDDVFAARMQRYLV